MFGYLADLRSQFDTRSAELDAGGPSSSSSSSSPLSAASTAFWSSSAGGGNWNISPLLNVTMWLHQVCSLLISFFALVFRRSMFHV
jgi:hypothetical protein